MNLRFAFQVKKATILMFNAAIHHNFVALSSLIADTLPSLMSILTFKSERIVDLGPFKHRVGAAAQFRDVI